MDYSTLTPGYQFPISNVTMEASAVEAYRLAVEDTSPLYSRSSVVPPTAVAAFALRVVLEHLGLAPGAIHVGQELEFLRTVPLGETLSYRATVAQSSVRGGVRFLAIDLLAEDGQGHRAMEGRITVTLPLEASTP